MQGTMQLTHTSDTSISHVLSDAALLTSGKKPNLMYALWIATMSQMQQLTVNGHMARVAARYVETGLPTDKDDFYHEVKKVPGSKMFTRQTDVIYAIEKWYHENKNDSSLMNIGKTYAEQCVWRDRLVATFYGLGLKCVSMAALIYDPFGCELIPLDRHHLEFLGILGKKKSISDTKEYMRIELQYMQWRQENEDTQALPLALYAWYIWELIRKEKGASKVSQGVESHVMLSCCDY